MDLINIWTECDTCLTSVTVFFWVVIEVSSISVSVSLWFVTL